MKTLLQALSVTLTLAAVALGVVVPTVARAAQDYDNCTGFIDALPATISTQGTWCLRHDLATSVTSGPAITVATNNVTIDCNDFKLGGSAAGATTSAVGVYAADRLNTTVRHCNIRGFFSGILMGGNSAGSVIEDNRFDGNTFYGMLVSGDNSTIRRNSVNDTGGSTYTSNGAYGILGYYSIDIRDNTISGVAPLAGGNANAAGIYTVANTGGAVDGNRVRGVIPAGIGVSYGIYNYLSARLSVENNVVVGNGTGAGLLCTGSDSRARDNIVNNFATAIDSCRDDGNSL